MDRDQARRDLAPALDRARRALEPADPDQIVKAIGMMADMIQCSMPEPDGITLYVSVLQELSAGAIRHACMEVCRTHPYPRLPLPFEILKAGAGPQAELQFWHQQLERALTLLSKDDPS